MIVFQTERLILSQFSLLDTSFITELTNTEGWLKNIGDRSTRTEAGAIAYLQKGPLNSYATTGFGLWKVSLKESNTPIGICGIFKRDIFEHPDIGYALLPAYEGRGYISEAALASMNFVFTHYNVTNLVGITDPANEASIRVLKKLGMTYRHDITLPGETETLRLFSLHPEIS